MRTYTIYGKGIQAVISDYGAKILRLLVPNDKGEVKDVVLGFNDLEEWQSKETFFNAVIGRVANRIKEGKFTLDGVNYQLPINNGPNSLHGGVSGFNEKLWKVMGQSRHSITLRYVAKDGEEGYPGNLTVDVTYQMTMEGGLKVIYEATTDKPTIAAFTQHAYFNLAGEGSGTVHDHMLQVFADRYTPFDDTACPTGEILPVEGTPMDFRQPTRIGDRIDDAFFVPGRGIDNNFVLNKKGKTKESELAAVCSADGRTMEVYTTMPGLQVYTGNWVEKNVGKSGRLYDVQHAVCLEAQYHPNSVNIPSFPSILLRPNEKLHEEVEYRFKVIGGTF